MVSALIPLWLVPFVSKKIGIEGYGHIAILLSWVGFARIFTEYSFNLTGPIKFLESKKNQALVFSEIVSTRLFLLIIIYLICCGYYLILGDQIIEDKSFWYLMIIAIGANAMNSIWLLQARNAFLSVTLITTGGVIAAISIGLLLDVVASNMLLLSAIALSMVGVMQGIASFLFARLQISGKITLVPFKKVLNILHCDKKLFLSQLVAIVYSGMGVIFIGFLTTTAEAGVFSVIEKNINALQAASLMVFTAAYPKMISLYKENPGKYLRLLQRVIFMYTLVTLCCISGLIIFQSDILNYLFGPNEARPYALYYLSMAWLVTGIWGHALTSYLMLSGKEVEVLRLTTSILIVVLLIGIPFVMIFGSWGWMAGLVGGQTLVIFKSCFIWKNLKNE